MVNRAELEQIRGLDEHGNHQAGRARDEGAHVPWGTLLPSPNMWAIMCAYFTYVYCLWIFLSWLPSYLVEARHFTLLKFGWYASIPLFAGVIGDTVGGVATDWLLKKTGSTKLARRSVAIVGLLGCAVFIVPAALTEDAYTALSCLTGAMFFLECTIGPSWAVPMDAGGKYSGTVSGMMNMAGNIGGALSPTVFGFLPSTATGRRRLSSPPSCSSSAPPYGPSGSIPIVRWSRRPSKRSAPSASSRGRPRCLAYFGRAMRTLNVHGFARMPAASRASVTSSFSASGASLARLSRHSWSPS